MSEKDEAILNIGDLMCKVSGFVMSEVAGSPSDKKSCARTKKVVKLKKTNYRVHGSIEVD